MSKTENDPVGSPVVLGKDYAQADKAGSFGRELLRLSEMMNQDHYPNAAGLRYIAAAIAIADTLADKVCPGDTDHSQLLGPFDVGNPAD
jgi:hypothetical protein